MSKTIVTIGSRPAISIPEGTGVIMVHPLAEVTAEISAQAASNSAVEAAAAEARIIGMETVVALGSVSGTKTIDLSLGTIFTATATGSCTWSFINPQPGVNSITLQLTNGGVTGQVFTGVKWPYNLMPGLSAAATDLLEFYSIDGWTTIRGLLAGEGYV